MNINFVDRCFSQLAEILNHIAQGNEVKIIPIQQELTISKAVEILNITRPYLGDLWAE